MWYLRLGGIALFVVAMLALLGRATTPALAQPGVYGMFVNNTLDHLVTFNAATMTVIGNVAYPVGVNTVDEGDVGILPDQTKAFATRFSLANSANVFSISPAGIPSLGPAPNAITTATQALEATVSPDGRYLVITDGGAVQPMTVIDTATQTIVSTFNTANGLHNSADACSDGSVVVTSVTASTYRRLLLSPAGILSDPGPFLTVAGAGPNNIDCAPGAQSAVAANRNTINLVSMRLPGMTLVSTQALPGTGLAIQVAVSPDGTKVFGRNGTNTTAYAYTASTGVIGAQLWTVTTAAQPTFYGIDGLDVTPDSTRVILTEPTQVRALDASTGATLGTINSVAGAAINPLGIAFATSLVAPPAPPSIDPNRQLGKQVHLPILNFQGQDDVCRTWIEVQNIGDGDAKAILVTWGEPGFCPPQCAGPLKVECSGLLIPGSTWNFLGAQIPTGSKSGMLFKFTAAQLSEIGENPVEDDIVADAMCETLFFGVVGDCDDYRRFKKAYNEGLEFNGINQGAASGDGFLAVDVLRHCPGDVTPGVEVSGKYNGIAGDHLGAFDPVFGGYAYYVPLIYADKAGFNAIMYIQNGGLECSSVEIWFKAQDDCLRSRVCEIFTLAPGETYQFDASDCVGPDWQGNSWVRSSQPLGIVVDIIGRDVLMTYIGEPAAFTYTFDPDDPTDDVVFNQGGQVGYAPLIYSEYMGWDSGIQVQNLSSITAAKVKVYFLDRSGDVITTLIDWVCPRGSQTFFLPVVATMPGNWVGSARIESQEWWSPGDPTVLPPDIVAVATLIRYNDAARTQTTEALAYNLLPEHKVYTWQIGTGLGSLDSGVGLIAIPSLLKDLDNTGVTSELAIANVVPKPGFTDFAIFFYDQNGLLDYVCEKLNEKQVEYIDFHTWGYVSPGFKGSAIISAIFWEHDVFAPTGAFVRNLLGLSAVAVERSGTHLGEDVPGDEAAGDRGIPFSTTNGGLKFRFLGHGRPNCPGVGHTPRQ